MSAETEKAVIDAIAAHFGSEYPGAFVDGFALTVLGRTVDDLPKPGEEFGSSRGLWMVLPDQSWTMTMGLVEELRIKVRDGYRGT